jgi:hypothetical protein
MAATDASVDACKSLDAPTKDNWKLFYTAWLNFRNADEGYLDAPVEWSACDNYAKALASWQVMLAAKSCGQNVPQIEPQGNKGSEITGTIKTVAIAASVVAVALVAREFLK